jgi:hypothetical protein
MYLRKILFVFGRSDYGLNLKVVLDAARLGVLAAWRAG